MTVRRYSGSCTVNIDLVEEFPVTFPDHPATYRCIVVDAKSKDRHEVFVGHPKSLVMAVDAPEAYDDAAHAALSFSMADDVDLVFNPDYKEDCSGFLIKRR